MIPPLTKYPADFCLVKCNIKEMKGEGLCLRERQPLGLWPANIIIEGAATSLDLHTWSLFNPLENLFDQFIKRLVTAYLNQNPQDDAMRELFDKYRHRTMRLILQGKNECPRDIALLNLIRAKLIEANVLNGVDSVVFAKLLDFPMTNVLVMSCFSTHAVMFTEGNIKLSFNTLYQALNFHLSQYSDNLDWFFDYVNRTLTKYMQQPHAKKLQEKPDYFKIVLRSFSDALVLPQKVAEEISCAKRIYASLVQKLKSLDIKDYNAIDSMLCRVQAVQKMVFSFNSNCKTASKYLSTFENFLKSGVQEIDAKKVNESDGGLLPFRVNIPELLEVAQPLKNLYQKFGLIFGHYLDFHMGIICKLLTIFKINQAAFNILHTKLQVPNDWEAYLQQEEPFQLPEIVRNQPEEISEPTIQSEPTTTTYS